MSEHHSIAGKFTSPILRYLQGQDKPRSAYEILDELRDHGAKAPMQIYRALAKLEEAELVHKLPKSNGWIACDGHHHDAVKQMLILMSCQSCGTVEEVQDAALQSAMDKLMAQKKFELPAQTIEVDGVCAPCKSQK